MGDGSHRSPRYGSRAHASRLFTRNLPLRQVEDRLIDLAQTLLRQRPAVRAREVAQDPLLALQVDELQALRLLVPLQSSDELESAIEPTDQRAVVVRDLLAELSDQWIAACLGHVPRVPAESPPGFYTQVVSANSAPELLIVMGAQATADQTEHVVARLQEAGVGARVSRGREATVIGAIGERELLATLPLEAFPGVEQVLPILKPYKLVARELSPDPTVIDVRGRRIGDSYFGLIAGPCTVENREQTLETARAVHAAGATMLRGGAFKPRTSPYTFQGLGEAGLEILAEAREETGLPLVTELLDPRHVEPVVETTDVIQIGARNMQNFLLLSEAGRADKPVLLKRGPSASVEELLMAAEYVVKEGNERVILCERGIKTFEQAMRYTLDLGAVPVLKHETHLPVIVDPSHAAGRRDLVLPLALAATAAGADGIIVEVHPRPEEALCDGPQQIPASEFADFARQVESVATLVGKSIG